MHLIGQTGRNIIACKCIVGTCCKFGNLVVVPSYIVVDLPCEVLGYYRTCVDRCFYTIVAKRTDVLNQVVTKVGTCCHRYRADKVGCLTVVVFHATIDAALQEAPVETGIVGGCLFPLQVAVIYFRTKCVVSLVTDCVLCILVTGHIAWQVVEVVTDVLLSGYTPTQTQLQFIECIAVSQELFFAYLPCQTYCREFAPTVVLREARRTVETHCCGEQVAIEKCVVQTSEVRYQCVGVDVFGFLTQRWRFCLICVWVPTLSFAIFFAIEVLLFGCYQHVEVVYAKFLDILCVDVALQVILVRLLYAIPAIIVVAV